MRSTQRPSRSRRRACAEDTKGQACYICTQALHWKTKEGLVRGCACRGTAGFAHVSCLAEQAKILIAEVGGEQFGRQGRFMRGCSVVHVQPVRARVPWRREVRAWVGVLEASMGRPETDSFEIGDEQAWERFTRAGHHEDALSVQEAELSMLRRLDAPEKTMLATQGNLANTYQKLGHHEKALSMERDVYSGRLRLNGAEHGSTLIAANNYASTLSELERFEEAKSLLRRTIPAARRVLGESNELMLKMRRIYVGALRSPTEPRSTISARP